MSTVPETSTAAPLPQPAYLADHDDPAALFTRLQRVGIHLEHLQNESMAGLDLSFRDFVILATLRREPPPHQLPVSRIAAYVLRPMGSISQALDRVEQAGHVSRSTARDDRRKVLVRLTPAGVAAVDEAFEAYASVRRRIVERLGADQLAAVDDAVTTLLVALDADYEEIHR